MTLHEIVVLPSFVSIAYLQRACKYLKRRCRSILCFVNGGHHHMKHAERERIVLKCYYCGDETKGWDV